MSFIKFDGVQIHYRFDGPADAPVLVLSNSLGTNLTMWDPQVPAFAPHFRVLRYDTRGHGLSTVAPGPYTIEMLSREVIGLLDGFGVQKAHFCGLSLGGMIGLWLGIHAADRLNRLVLCNTAALIGTAETWNARIAKVRESGMSVIASAVIERWFTSAFAARKPAIFESMRQMLAQSPAEGYIASCAAVRDMDARAAVSCVQVPTLIISGSRDLATPPADGRFLTKQIRGARYVELEAAHLSNIEAATEFTEAVLQFLTEPETN